MMTIEKETRQLSFEDIKEKLSNKYTMILDNLTEPMTARELAHKLYRLNSSTPYRTRKAWKSKSYRKKEM